MLTSGETGSLAISARAGPAIRAKPSAGSSAGGRGNAPATGATAVGSAGGGGISLLTSVVVAGWADGRGPRFARFRAIFEIVSYWDRISLLDVAIVRARKES